MDDLNFDSIALREVPVSVAGKKYILREAVESVIITWRDSNVRHHRLVDGKPVATTGGADTDSLFVSLCLFPVNDEGQSAAASVPHSVVKTWPQRIVRALFSKAADISNLLANDTIETLTKQRNEIDAKIAKLSAAGNGHVEDPAKNELKATPVT